MRSVMMIAFIALINPAHASDFEHPQESLVDARDLDARERTEQLDLESGQSEVQEWIASASAWTTAAEELRRGVELWTATWTGSAAARSLEAKRAASVPEWTSEVAEAAKRTGGVALATAEGALAVQMEDVAIAWARCTDAWETASHLISQAAVVGWTAAAATATAAAARATAAGATAAESPTAASAWAEAAQAFDTAAVKLTEAEAAAAVSTINLGMSR
eukprot:gnl/MRDRNA2_/MRDRNA2_55819_c0_seq1.p1 gnl/MRDRNA2_/MRDRNA2_55819_c0~~gnl/MRDRNA2_/MRDRNA2_55819_c0_seq1.p1  ORF type:complete len:220 (+),score=59.08 gnl/MRDRNA2_/MRDRNA2_55819_c0_seq1:76-735(+)